MDEERRYTSQLLFAIALIILFEKGFVTGSDSKSLSNCQIGKLSV